MTEEELAELTRQNREAAERQHEEERLNKGRDELDTLFDPRRQFFRDGQGARAGPMSKTSIVKIVHK